MNIPKDKKIETALSPCLSTGKLWLGDDGKSWLKAPTLLLGLLISSFQFFACDIPFFPFERTPDLPRGSITGVVMRGEEPAAFASIVVQGAGKIVAADSAGAFQVNGLGKGRWSLRVLDDENNDGVVDRSMVRTFLIDEIVVSAETPILQQDVSEPNTLYLGTLILNLTTDISGTVEINGNLPSVTGSNVKVYATREVNYFEGDSPQSFAFSFGAEAVTHVDAQGNFRFNGVLIDNPEGQNVGGPLYAIAVQFNGTGATSNEVLTISEPFLLAEGATPAFNLPALSTSSIRSVLHTLNSDLLDGRNATEYSSYILLKTPGAGDFPTCNLGTVPELSVLQTRFPDVKNVVPFISVQSEMALPLGIWDVQFCLTVDDRTFQGFLSEQILGPGSDGDPAPLWGPYALLPIDKVCKSRCLTFGDDSCEQDALLPDGEGYHNFRDCDEDSARGIPVLGDNPSTESRELVDAIRAQCGEQCSTQLNTNDRCTVAGLDATDFNLTLDPNGEYDCDDDGDTQADTTEAQNCYGPGLGTDLDGDGICSGLDAFPECAANSAAACEAGTNDVAPVPTDVGGGGEEPVDAGVGDAGTTSRDDDSGTALVVDSDAGTNVDGGNGNPGVDGGAGERADGGPGDAGVGRSDAGFANDAGP
ncbi:MAG: carboxypeptidase-like regulatory domain-containing protein [Deltaproteobacteria bacterium]|nr:carboxypeptidase-like regulatory domain-containing protein [Deltaproteobacteria bacterium]